MSDAAASAQWHRNRMYNSPSDIRRRAEAKQTKPSEIGAFYARRRDDESEMGAKHRAETLKMVSRHQQERARDRAVRNGMGDGAPAMLRKHRDERAALDAAHAAERQNLVDKHNKAFAAIMARNPAP